MNIPYLPLLNGAPVQIFPLIYEGVNKTAGDTVTGITMISCVEDGDIVVTFPEGNKTISCVEGDQFGFIQKIDIAISTGTFHVA